jgi:hypothetical protein
MHELLTFFFILDLYFTIIAIAWGYRGKDNQNKSNRT